jgi:hypothetical protein
VGFKVSEEYFMDFASLEVEDDRSFNMSGYIHGHGVTSHKMGKLTFQGN